MRKNLAKIVCAGVALMAPAAFGQHNEAGKRAAALDNSLWEKAEWISVADAPVVTGRVGDNERAADGAGWFVTTVKNGGKVADAKWMTTGLGVYELYVNGKAIGEEVLKPGFTHHSKSKLSFTYDITDAFNKKNGAENMLAVQVTPGWWADKIVTPAGHEGMIGKKVAFRGVLELTYADGKKEYFGTNTTDWKAGIAGPVKHAGIFDGEQYDAREQPGYADPSKLKTPEVNREFAGQIFPSHGAEVYLREDLTLEPVEAYTWKGVTGARDGEFGKIVKVKDYRPGEEISLMPGETLVVDFGQNSAAVPQFKFAAREGTTLSCYPSEILNDGNGAVSRGMDGPEGSCHRTNLRMHEQGMRLNYTFANNGDKYVSYRPGCTFYGYRYMSVTADAPVKIKKIESVPVTSIADNLETGKIETGNEMVNKLISNTIWGQRSNYLSVPTDCPQRNERLGWTADTQVFTKTGTYFADTKDFFHKWMRDMRDTQNEHGSFPGVAPEAQYGAYPTDMCRLGWSDAGVIVPWVVWSQFGDKEIVDENWAAMEKYMNHLNDTKYRHEALVEENGNYQWADWLSYEPLESCSGRKDYQDENGNWHTRPEAVAYWNYLSASYWLMDAEMMAEMAAGTGRSTDAKRYEAMAEEAREMLQKEHLNADGTFKTEILNTMQTPALFALRGKLVDGKAKEDMKARLRKNFAEHDNCLQTGFLGTSILMPTLTANGMSDIAYELLLQRKNPSWLYSIDNGATTIWERWNSYMKDSGMGPKGMNSFNHYAYGCVCEWMWESMAGIATDTKEPGFKRIIMKPVPDKRLGYVKAEYASAAGTIKSHWQYDGDLWKWSFTVPEGAVAEVTLPGESESKEYKAGKYSVEKRL